VKPQNGCGNIIKIHNIHEETNFAKKDIVRPRIETRMSLRVAAAQITTDWRITNH
jgi:hypothetical protein